MYVSWFFYYVKELTKHYLRIFAMLFSKMKEALNLFFLFVDCLLVSDSTYRYVCGGQGKMVSVFRGFAAHRECLPTALKPLAKENCLAVEQHAREL